MATKRVGLSDRMQHEVKKRPLEALIRPKEEVEKDSLKAEEENRNRFMAYKVPTRKTFLLDPITIEAIRIFTFRNRKGLSEAMMDMLLKYIPADIWTEARGNIIDIEQTPADYLEDLEKLDIDSIYYHNK